MSDPNLQDFIDLSAELTGLSAKLLAPAVDPINLPPDEKGTDLFFPTEKRPKRGQIYFFLNKSVPFSIL